MDDRSGNNRRPNPTELGPPDRTETGALGAWTSGVDRGRPWLDDGAASAEAGSARAIDTPVSRGYVDLGGPAPDPTEAEIERIRSEARRLAREDAERDAPAEDAEGPVASELELKDRCLSLLRRWESREERGFHRDIADQEERILDRLGKIALGIDRFERLVNELIRLKARFALRQEEVTQELNTEGQRRSRGLPTGAYVSALVFLGLVEFFANAPVFNALLPRDPISERQIQLLTELTTGWFAGMERVAAHILFRPDAALLAAGVITFLCVLAHFFGHALRDLVMQGERKDRRHTVHSRSAKENIVPLVLCAVGLVLTLGVLYEARVTLGEVGEERYVQDMEQVEELRRQAGWLRVDGHILDANQLDNRAEDVEAVATELREYSLSMARMNLPILLLNLTLVLCAISAAYFHRRDARKEHFNESPFEDERRALVETGEECAGTTSELLAKVGRDIRGLKSQLRTGPASRRRSLVHELESVFATYRAENIRIRRVDPRSVVAFATPMKFESAAASTGVDDLVLRDPADYERERGELVERFTDLRRRFTQESGSTW